MFASSLKIDCSIDSTNYILRDDICTADATDWKERRKLKEMRLSFMSGHASFSAYTMIFLIVSLIIFILNRV